MLIPAHEKPRCERWPSSPGLLAVWKRYAGVANNAVRCYALHVNAVYLTKEECVTASDLPQLAQNDAGVRKILDDAGIGHRTAARFINAKCGEGTTSEKSVRRYRSKRMSPEALSNPNPVAQPTVRPSGGSWNAGIDIDPAVGGEFRTKPREVGQPTDPPLPEPEEAALLAEFDLDPAVWRITHARKSLWQSGDKWLEARKVSFVRREADRFGVEVDIDAIMSQYTTARRAAPRPVAPERIMMVPAGDLQLGKPEGGGSPATIERFCRITEDIADEIDRGGFNTSLILPWMGDCVEGLVSQRGRLVASLDLTITQQVRAYRRLMMHQLGVLAPRAIKVIIPVLPGNHDEAYREQSMPVHDSWAIEGASAVADWMDGRPGYEHVEFVFPDPDELGITINVGTEAVPYVISFHHGHKASTPAGIIPWWMKQSHGRQHAGKADMLVTAHFHHLRAEHTGGNRTWLQIPALDGGSDWYRHHSGEEAVTGMVSVEITPGRGQGWRNLTVHS